MWTASIVRVPTQTHILFLVPTFFHILGGECRRKVGVKGNLGESLISYITLKIFGPVSLLDHLSRVSPNCSELQCSSLHHIMVLCNTLAKLRVKSTFEKSKLFLYQQILKLTAESYPFVVPKAQNIKVKLTFVALSLGENNNFFNPSRKGSFGNAMQEKNEKCVRLVCFQVFVKFSLFLTLVSAHSGH